MAGGSFDGMELRTMELDMPSWLAWCLQSGVGLRQWCRAGIEKGTWYRGQAH